MRSVPLALAVLLVFASASQAQDLEGQYRVRGTNPGGGSGYTGAVTVARSGQTYQVTWQIGSTRYVGTGIGGPTGIAVTYRSGDSTGLALYVPSEQGGYKGVWTYAGGRQIGEEFWTR